MFENIPKNWKKDKLKNYIDIIRGVNYNSNEAYDVVTPDTTTLLRANNISSNGTINFDKVIYVSNKNIKDEQIIKKNDILVAMSSGSKDLVGKAAQSSSDLNCSFGAFCSIVRPKIINPKFIGYYFQTDFYRTKISELSTGININNLRKEYIENLDIAIPSTLEEQQEIVDVLDAASEIIRLRTACIESAQSLIPALFQEMFGDPINNKKNLSKEKIGKILTLTSGKFIPSKELDNNGQYPVYGGNGINGYHNEFLFEDSKICIGRVGVKCGCVHKTKPNSWITDNALYINNYLIPINETYLKEALTQINLNQYAKRAAQPVISQTTIYNQYILLPPIEQQELFAKKVQEIETYIKTQQAELENAKTMFQSLLHHSFTGELTRHKFGGDTNG